ncbi:MAG: flagellar filament capping protein FliD [Bacillota bacterium]
MIYYFNPVNRMTGLASGLDTKSIVEDLMKAARIPLDRMLQSQQLLQWKKEDYRAINTTLTNLRTSYVFPLKLQSSFLVKKATSSDESVVAATASTKAISGIYTITRVDQLAAAHSVASDVVNPVVLEDTFINSANIDLANTTAYVDYAKGKVTTSAAGTEVFESINKTGLNVSKFRFNASTYVPSGTSITFYYSTDGGSTWTAVNAGDEVTLGTPATQLKFKAELTGTADAKPELLDYSFQDISQSFEGTFKINGKSITVAAGTTSLTTIRDLINNANAGVTAQVADSRLIITSNAIGSGGAIQFVDDAGTDILTKLGVLTNTDTIKNELQAARDAQLVYGGLTITRSANVITDLIQGVTLELKKTSASPVTINVSTDADAVVGTIKQFIDQYNAALDQIVGELKEERYRDYLPLTEDQKKEMSEDEIKKWEEKARSGLLKSDPILNDILVWVRNAVERAVAGAPRETDVLYDIGITFGDYWSGTSHRLYLDETKLRETISTNPDGVMQLFTKTGATEEEKGIGIRLYDALKRGIDRLKDEAGSPSSYFYDTSYLSESIRDLQERIDAESERLAKLEESYWRQFTAMEQFIAQMNSQSMWLAQQFNMYAAG